ncbi:MAG: glycosyltransferase [Chloroflexi bacterium]|nr:glycosyltransferase [Chloroflexota bacterium]MCL5108026.1 glycosyltransferase [Chloroflexota bacterium]
MLQLVKIEPSSLADYASLVGEEEIESIRSLGRSLKGLRVLHLSATAYGGGVAEILARLVPLMRDAGIMAEWRIIYGSDEFFNVTKTLHNALQGADVALDEGRRAVYERFSALNAEAFDGEYDVVVVHDPQPAAVPALRERKGARRWIWRCHIDTSHANLGVWSYLKSFLLPYDAAIFTLPQYVPADSPFPRLSFIPPSIDPLAAKNSPLDRAEASRVLARLHVDPNRPLLLQVARFDPWKDPLGVIDSYRMVKIEVPTVQLVLAGSMATDDPEGWDYYERTLRHAGADYDIRVLHNLHGVGDLEINALQTLADVVIQKSTREGFGLSVSEALWKGTPVVAGDVGGIPLQVIEGETGYLVTGPLACAERVYSLLRQPELRSALGTRGREHVRQRFLITRHLKDYLELFGSLLTPSPTDPGKERLQ